MTSTTDEVFFADEATGLRYGAWKRGKALAALSLDGNKRVYPILVNQIETMIVTIGLTETGRTSNTGLGNASYLTTRLVVSELRIRACPKPACGRCEVNDRA